LPPADPEPRANAAADSSGPDEVDQPVELELPADVENLRAQLSSEQASAGGDDSPRTADLQLQLHESQQRVLRAQAELENFRRRSRRETDERLRLANQPLLTDLLPVIDNLDRALTAAASPQNQQQGLLQGVQMVADQLQSVLRKHHCIRIEAVGQPFDPAHHEAIMQQPSKEYPAGTVMHVALEGYQLHERVIRPAQVIVSTGPPDSEP
jgi:molecular chaperone GrpE